MRRSISKAVLLALGAALAGCDTDSIAPPAQRRPRSTSSSPSPSGNLPARAKEIAMVLPDEDNVDLMLYDLVARNAAGVERVVYRAFKPASGSPTTAQAELIRQAAGSGASALIVVPDRSKETAEALAAVDPKKTPLVILGRSPSIEPPPSATVVAFEPFATSARKMAESVAADLRTIGAPDDASAVILSRWPADETSAERDGALLGALQQVGVPLAAKVRFSPESGDAEKVLTLALNLHPKAWAVIADDDQGIIAAHGARRPFAGRRYLVAGYFSLRNNLASLMNGQTSALADRNVEGLVRRAVRVAVGLANGESSPPRVEVPIEVLKGHLVESAPAGSGPIASPTVIDPETLLAPPRDGKKP